MNQSQTTEKASKLAKQAEAIGTEVRGTEVRIGTKVPTGTTVPVGTTIHNPPQVYTHSVKVGGRTHNIVDKDGIPLGGKDNSCHINIMINGTIYTLPTGATYVFPIDAAAHLLRTYPWLEEIKDRKLIEVAPLAPTREPTEREAPILWAAKKAASKGRKFFALTEDGDRVLISADPGQTFTPAPLDKGITMTEH